MKTPNNIINYYPLVWGVPAEIYLQIFPDVPLTSIQNVSRVSREWYLALQSEEMKSRLLNKLNIRANPNISLGESIKTLMQTVFCATIDVSASMGDMQSNESNLKKSIEYILEKAAKIIPEIPPGNFYLMQFGGYSWWKNIRNLDEAKEFLAYYRVDQRGSDITGLYSNIDKLYRKNIYYKAASRNKDIKMNHYPRQFTIKKRMEVEIVSDLRINEPGKLNPFWYKNIDIFYTLVEKHPEATAFWKSILDSEGLSQKSNNTEKTDLEPQIYHYGRASLVLSDIKATEIKRPL